MKKRLLALLLIALMVVSLVPAAALAAEPAADATVRLTVSNAGTLALARAEVTVKDLNEDGKLSYDEALVAAHEKYCPDGYAAAPSSYGGLYVTKLWGVENAGYLFYVNDAAITSDVETDTVKDGDELTAAVLSDGVTYGDVYTYFTEKTAETRVGEPVELTIKASSFSFSNIPGAGLQAGVWKDGTFTPQEGAVADADGEVSITFDTPGTYVVSATGTIRNTVTTDYQAGTTEERDCPVIAPVCTVKVTPPETFDYEGDSLNFIKMNGDAFGMYRVQNGSSAVLSEDGENVDIVFYPNNKKTYKGFYLNALVGNKETWKEENFQTPTALGTDEPYGVYTFSVSKDLCGKAVAIAPIKAKDGGTSADQYYMAIPAADKLPYYAPARDAEVKLTVSNAGTLALARADVTVKDLNEDGKLSYDEALTAAHEKYCPDGYAAVPSSYGGLYVTKLWGVENAGCLFYINDAGITSDVGTDTVKDGDELTAAVLSDGVTYGDVYTYFTEKTAETRVGEPAELTLKASSFSFSNVPAAGLRLGIWDEASGMFIGVAGITTDEDGKASIVRDEPGTYVISAEGTIKNTVTTDYEAGTTEEKDCPIIAPVCVLTVKPQPAEDADVYVTVSKEGVLALARAVVTVKDLNEDGKLSYDEALVATHEKYCPDGYALKESSSGMSVSKLWGVENGGNYQFYVNDKAIGTGVVEDTVKAGDELNAAVMTDTSLASDYYIWFDTQTKNVRMGEEFTLTAKAWNMLQDWGYYPELTAAGLQVGTWADGTFTAIDGAVIGDDEMVALTFDEPGTYVVTADGVLDYEGIMDMPIIPPICVVEVAPPLQFDYDGTELKMISYSGDNFGMLTPQEGSKAELSADGKTVTVTLIPKNGKTYKGFYLMAAIDDPETWTEENFLAGAENTSDRPYGIYEFTISADYCGKATAIAPIKAKDGGTTAAQYYIAIPALKDEVKPAFKSQSLVLSGQIAVKFNLELPEIEGVDYKDSYVEFTVGKSAPVKVGYDQATLGSNGRYGFLCYVKSIQMADTITAVFHYGDGKTVSKEYSVERYIKTVEERQDQFDEKTLNLVHAIADFGHYAQLYLSEVNGWRIGEDYAAMNTFYADSYDYADILSKVSPKAFVKTLGTSNVEKATYKLHLDAETTVDVYLTPKNGAAITASATFNGKTYTAVKQSDGRYLVRIPNISAHMLGDMITINGTAGSAFTVQVCALSYVRSVLNNAGSTEAAKNGLASLYAYYDATMAYRKK